MTEPKAVAVRRRAKQSRAALKRGPDGKLIMMKRRRKSRVKPGLLFGELLVIKRVRTPSGASGGQRWECECLACGRHISIPSWYLIRPQGPKRNCGCRKNEKVTHTRERAIFYMMHRRCYNPTHQAYHHYGGAEPPIKVVDRWNKDVVGNEVAFANFMADMGKAPTKGHTLDRIDPYGWYGPDNCRWATHTEQMNNLKRHWPHPSMRAKIQELAAVDEADCANIIETEAEPEEEMEDGDEDEDED